MTQPQTESQVLTIEHSPMALVIMIRAASGQAAWGTLDQAGSTVLAEFQNHPRSACLVDLSPLPTLGSAQVALLVRIWKAVRDSSGEFLLVGPQKAALEVIELAGLHKLWKILPHRSAADDWLMHRQQGQASSARWYRAWLSVAVCGLAAAVAGWMAPAGGLALGRVADESARQFLWGTGCGVGIVSGCVSVLSSAGRRRIPGALLALVALLLAAAGVMQLTHTGRIGPGAEEAAPGGAAL